MQVRDDVLDIFNKETKRQNLLEEEDFDACGTLTIVDIQNIMVELQEDKEKQNEISS